MLTQELDNQNNEHSYTDVAQYESEKISRLIADKSPVMVWIASTDIGANWMEKLPILPQENLLNLPLRNYFNKVWLKFTGRTLAQENGNGWLENVHPEDSQKYLDAYTSAVANRQNFQQEYRLRRFDGEYRWILETSNPWFLEDGNFAGYIGSCVDISERKFAETLIQERLNILQTVIDGIPDPIFAKNSEGRHILINPACIPIFGRSGEEIIGKDDMEIWPPEVARKLKETDREIIKTGEIQVIEEDVPKNGIMRTYLSTKSVYRDPQGNIAGLIGIARDITEQKQTELALKLANEQLGMKVESHTLKLKNVIKQLKCEIGERQLIEQALRESQQYNRSLFEQCPSGLILCQMDGKVVDANPSFAAIIGFSVQETLNLTWWQLTPAKYLKAEVEQLDILGKTGRYGPYEKEFFHKDRHLVPVRLSGLIIERNGEPLILSSVEDITERKQAETALRESAAQTRLIADILPAYISYVDSEQRYRWLNKKYEEWFSKSTEDIAGNYVKDIQGEKAYQQIKKHLQIALAGKPLRYELKNSFPNGEDHYLDVAYIPHWGEMGNVLGCVVFTQDITERKKAEEALRRSEYQAQESARIAEEKAEQLEIALHKLQETQTQLIQTEKMSSLGQMVAGIAHEINNPINFIHGNIQYAEEYMKNLLDLVQIYQQHYPQPSPEIQAKLEEIELDYIAEDLSKIIGSMRMGTERISQMVLSLRNFSRLDESEVKDVNLHEGIDNTLLILNNRLKKGIAVIKSYGNLPLIECYPAQLNQVFMNIISNAIDALLDGELNRNKQILIQTKTVSITEIVVKITDTGSGIPPHIKDKIFDPFFTTKTIGKGTGLGLSICYKIIQRHGGKIEVNSQVGVGSEFAIYLPVKQGRRE